MENKFCWKPFGFLEISGRGLTNHLCCSSWLPFSLGSLETNSVEKIFNSKIAQDIRKSILEGTFSYCDHNLCPDIQSNRLPTKKEVTDEHFKSIIDKKQIKDLKPTFYNLCYDESCNLQCPSCRRHKINYTSGKEYAVREKVQKKVIEELFSYPHTRKCTVSITGAGDPFGSKLYRELLFQLDGSQYPNVSINLQTNGVMFTPKYWEKMHKIHSNIDAVLISVDAGTEETYQITRKGGNWNLLNENLEFISELRQNGKINLLRLDFVIQAANYKEIDLMIKLGEKLKVDSVYLSRLADWDTWSKTAFNQQAIWKKTHPNHQSFLDILQKLDFNDYKTTVNIGNLSQFLQRGKKLPIWEES